MSSQASISLETIPDEDHIEEDENYPRTFSESYNRLLSISSAQSQQRVDFSEDESYSDKDDGESNSNHGYTRIN